jgi:hypothetical protein
MREIFVPTIRAATMKVAMFPRIMMKDAVTSTGQVWRAIKPHRTSSLTALRIRPGAVAVDGRVKLIPATRIIAIAVITTATMTITERTGEGKSRRTTTVNAS